MGSPPPAATAGPSAKSWSRRPMMRSLGESALPVAQAGHASWQRPHSVHEKVSITCFHVMSATVPEPSRMSSSGPSSSKRSGSSRPRARVRPKKTFTDRGRDMEVLGVRQIGQEPDDEEHVRPDEDALGVLGPRPAAEEVRERVRHRRPPGRPLVQVERDPRRVPQEERRHDPRDERQDQVGLADVAALEPGRPLHLADHERRDDAGEHEHGEDVHEEREPALASEPRDRRILRDDRDDAPSRWSGRARGSPRR